MASILITLPECREQWHEKLLKETTNLVCKVVGSKPETEGDRIRCGEAFISDPREEENGTKSIFVEWPDGLYPRLAYELRGFVASQKGAQLSSL